MCDRIGTVSPFSFIPKSKLQDAWKEVVGRDSVLSQQFDKRFNHRYDRIESNLRVV